MRYLVPVSLAIALYLVSARPSRAYFSDSITSSYDSTYGDAVPLPAPIPGNTCWGTCSSHGKLTDSHPIKGFSFIVAFPSMEMAPTKRWVLTCASDAQCSFDSVGFPPEIAAQCPAVSEKGCRYQLDVEITESEYEKYLQEGSPYPTAIARCRDAIAQKAGDPSASDSTLAEFTCRNTPECSVGKGGKAFEYDCGAFSIPSECPSGVRCDGTTSASPLAACAVFKPEQTNPITVRGKLRFEVIELEAGRRYRFACYYSRPCDDLVVAMNPALRSQATLRSGERCFSPGLSNVEEATWKGTIGTNCVVMGSQLPGLVAWELARWNWTKGLSDVGYDEAYAVAKKRCDALWVPPDTLELEAVDRCYVLGQRALDRSNALRVPTVCCSSGFIKPK